MLDVCLLGTGGMLPLPKRYLTSLFLRYNGNSILIDCGEATQMAIKEAGLSPYSISMILITHFHADHVSGLPGLLLTLGNCDRTEPLLIAGPKGLKYIVDALRVISPKLPYKIEYFEYSDKVVDFSHKGYDIRAFRVDHGIDCYGYSIKIKRLGKFDIERAKKLNLPVKYWKILQNGQEVDYEGRIYYPNEVMGHERRGIHIVYSTDTRPTNSLEEEAKDADLFICEGMYGYDEKIENAKKYKHMTMKEAIDMASRSKPRELWLTHYSPSNINPQKYEKTLKKTFPNLVVPRDGYFKTINFENGDTDD